MRSSGVFYINYQTIKRGVRGDSQWVLGVKHIRNFHAADAEEDEATAKKIMRLFGYEFIRLGGGMKVGSLSSNYQTIKRGALGVKHIRKFHAADAEDDAATATKIWRLGV